MKKIINAPGDVVEDYIRGLVSAEPHLARVEDWPVVVRTPAARKPDDRVAVVTGGGSGHEPAHAGYVGVGMLDAAVLGPVFTSPSVDAVYAAIRAVATQAGVLLIVKNYTGDRLNFGLAAEMARADGIAVEMVVVSDDAALGDAAGAGRRGLTATVLAHKVAGAAAEEGRPLAAIVALLQRLLSRAATMGVALGACSVPGAAQPNFDLADDEVEWGLGIHGEPGLRRGRMASSREIAAELVTRSAEAAGVAGGDDAVVLVNSLGGTPDLELRVLQGDVLAALAQRGVRIAGAWAGPFLTSLEMPGASVTVAGVDEELLSLLRQPAEVVAFPPLLAVEQDDRPLSVSGVARTELRRGPGGAGAAALHARVAALSEAVIDSEDHLTSLDRRVGDGDLGTNLARGARAVLAAGDLLASQADETAYLRGLADILRREIGGTSGPLYSILALAMAEALDDGAHNAPSSWSRAFAHAVDRVRAVGGAAPGDRTMVDALAPAAEALQNGADDDSALARAASAARSAAEATAMITANRGRSSYLGERAIGVPDPGAIAVALLLERLADRPSRGAARASGSEADR